jgi:HAMP domain-containing protein
MTDEERKRLCDYLRYPTGRHDADILDRLCKEAEKAADEIERLAAEVERLTQECSEEITWAADEIERLAKENKFLQLQLNGLRDLWAERDADRPKPLPNLNSTSLQRDLPIKRS